MLKSHTICASLLLLILSLTNAQAQGDIAKSATPEALTITASASDGRVRFTAPASVVQIRLEVYASTGQKLFDNELRGGNVLDWRLQNGQAEPLLDDTYLCVVTVKNLSGKITQRIGSVKVDKSAASLQPAAASQMTPQQSDAIGPVEENAPLTILNDGQTQTATVIAHDGTDGQLTRGRGALSFRLGDFFAGTDKEQMRLTEEGNLGIGTSDPKVKLDVAGMIGARQGLMFSDGSTLGLNKKGILTHTSATGDVSPSISGTGTTNQITKWSNGPAGVVADSALFESGGNVGLGTILPDSIFHLAGPAGVNALTFNTPGTTRGRFGTLPGIPDWLGIFLNAKYSGGGWLLDNTAQTGWFFKLDNRIAVDEFAVYKIPPGAGPHTNEFPRFVLRSSGGGALGTMPLGYTPASTLDVVSDGSLDVLQWKGTAAGSVLGAIKANGNVGIGAPAPLARLDVRGDVFVGLPSVPVDVSTAQNALYVANDSGDIRNHFRIDGFANNLAIVAHSGTGSPAGASISLRTAAAGGLDTDRVTIDPSGKVSIGATASPGARLYVETSSGGAEAVRGKNTFTSGSAATFEITNASNAADALFVSTVGTGPSLVGTTFGSGDALLATAFGTGFAGNFTGDINVTGTIFGPVKAFKIDHPLDPANKNLVHASIESSEVKNLYDGVVVLDPSGEAIVVLPDWFESLNRDFRYQLTCIGGSAQVYVAEEIANHRFKIAGGGPGMKVSWQVTGNRQDPFTKAHPMQVEQAKPEIERGFYIHPELYGQPEEMGIQWAHRPEQMRQMKEQREKLSLPKQ